MGDFTKSISKLIPIYGTYLRGKLFINNPSWKGVKELARPISRDAALLTGGITGASTGLVAGNTVVKAYKSAKVLNSLGKSLVSRIRGNEKPATVTETPLKSVRLKNGSMIYKMRDGTWRNEKGLKLVNFASPLLTPEKKEVPAAGKPAVKNTSTATPPQSTVTPPPSLSTVLFTPGILNNGLFTPTGESTTLFDKASLIPLFTPKPLETFGPGTFNTNVTYNSGNIRANRGVNYSNVNEYWDYLNNNKDSNDYKLFLNIMRTTDGNLNRDVFDLTMAKYGISGNLGRRDSGRLANLLNDLNLIGTEGSDARNSFIDSYNNHFSLALKETPVKKWTPQGGDWRSNLLNVLSLSYRKKGGTLSPRNPIARFKDKFLVSGPVTTLKTGGEIPKLLKGYKVKKGDTLFKIALRLTGNGNNYKELAKFNNIKNADVIEVGQVINLPGHLNSPSTTSSTKPSNNKKLKDPQILKRLEFLFKNGYYPKGTPLNIAVDGMMGPETLKAESRAAKSGIYYSNGRYIKSNSWRPSQQQCKKVFNPVTGKYTTECSEYANLELLNFKGGTYYTGVAGDAWTRLSNGEFVENGYNYLDNPNIGPVINLGPFYNNSNSRKKLMYNYSLLAADKFKEHFDPKKLDPKEVYMANLYFEESPNIEKAFTNATGIKGKQKATRGTHTGNVWYDGANWRISHNIHGEEHTENLSDVLGSGHKWGVTALSRVRHNKLGGIIEKFQKGKPVTINLEQEMKTPNPNGYSLKNIGITRTGTLNTYGNSDSALISGSLLYLNSRLPELANRYNLSYDEARNLLGLVLASEWEESGGGNYNKVTNDGKYKPNSAYVEKHLSPLGNLLRHLANGFMGRETSEGLASVKLKDLLSLPNYSIDTDRELLKLPKNGYLFGGLSTFASMALRYLKLKELTKNNPELIYNEDGSLSDTGSSLVLASHNLGFNNIEKNINNTVKTGKDELSLYLNFYYPRLTMLVVKGHNIAGSKPHVLPEVVVTGRKR